MLILGIDTSTKFLSLSISEDESIIGECNIELGNSLSQRLIPILKNFLKKHKKEITDIDGFAVDIGPGSFTGLRIGVATIKGLAFTLNKPIVAIPSLDIMAEAILVNNQGLICPIIDAKRNLVYSCIYKAKGFEKISKYLLISIEDLLKKIKEDTIFLGDGVNLYKENIKNRLGKKAIFAPEEFWYPKAISLLKLSHEKFKKHQTKNVHKVLPLYLYPKECQVNIANI